MAQILDWNHIPNPNMIHIGQLINLGEGKATQKFVAQSGQNQAQNQKAYVAQQKLVSQSQDSHTYCQATQTQTIKNQLSRLTTTTKVSSSHTQQTVANKPVQNTQANGSLVASEPVQHKPVATKLGADNPAYQEGNQTQHKPVTPSKPSKPVTPDKPQPNQQLNADAINDAYQQSLSNKYGWQGKWQDSSDGYYYDSDDAISGYADAAISGKWVNKNQELGNQAAAATNRDNSHYKNYKYGYTEVNRVQEKDGTSSARVNYYFWNE